jgi:hypothetical protein
MMKMVLLVVRLARDYGIELNAGQVNDNKPNMADTQAIRQADRQTIRQIGRQSGR